MTLVIQQVKHAEYRKDNSIVFYVICEGVSGVVDVTLQSGAKNEYNNSVLQAWLDNNTPSAYFDKIDIANAEIEKHKTDNSSLINKSIDDLIFMTDAEKLQYKADKETYTEALTALHTKANDADNEYITEKLKKDNA